MAGIGFELKKLFSRSGVGAMLRAYGYAGVICAGPMLLGVILLLGVMLLVNLFGTSRADQDLLVCMITYTLLFSLTVTSFFSMVVTRFIADKIYDEQKEAIFPSLVGSSVIQLIVGDVLFFVFLCFCGAQWIDCVLMFILFTELIVVWNQMSYLTAIKDYRSLTLSFLAAVVITFLVGFVLLKLDFPAVEAMLAAVCVGYGVMLIANFRLLWLTFPKQDGLPFDFLAWLEDNKKLAFIGLFTNIGLFAHLVIMWFGPIGVKVLGLFYGAPYHDVPALLAFMTILVTTVNYVVSVEVNFYPKYRIYYSLYNDQGNVRDIDQAEKEMLDVLHSELLNTCIKQLLVTMVAIAVESLVLDLLPLGFNDLMHGYFRTLCVGYGLYACGNVCMLLLLYFTDYSGALITTGLFAVGATAFTVASLWLKPVFFGIGFVLGCALFFGASLLRLNQFTRSLSYHILSRQDVVFQPRSGLIRKLMYQLNQMVGVKE